MALLLLKKTCCVSKPEKREFVWLRQRQLGVLSPYLRPGWKTSKRKWNLSHLNCIVSLFFPGLLGAKNKMSTGLSEQETNIEFSDDSSCSLSLSMFNGRAHRKSYVVSCLALSFPKDVITIRCSSKTNCSDYDAVPSNSIVSSLRYLV